MNKKNPTKKRLIEGYREMASEAIKITREFDEAKDMADFKEYNSQEKNTASFNDYLKRRNSSHPA